MPWCCSGCPRPEDGRGGSFYALQHEGGEILFPLLDAVEADLFNIVNGGFQPYGPAGVHGPGLELMGDLGVHRALAADGLDHLAAEEEGGHGVEPLFFAPEHADAHGGQHLVAGEGQKVHVQVLHIDLDVGDALGAVGDDHDVALAVAEGGGRFHVVLPAEDVGHLGHGDELGLVGDRFLQGFQGDLARGITFQKLQGRAVPLGGLEPGEKVAVVLHDGDDHFVAGWSSSSARQLAARFRLSLALRVKMISLGLSAWMNLETVSRAAS